MCYLKKKLQRERLINLLTQDLNCSNETKKIIEHVELGLCTQRKTSSRNFTTRLNRLGHCFMR